MGVSNFGLKIWPEVVLWQFMRMRIRKLAKQKIVELWPNLQNVSSYRKSGTESTNMESNFTPVVVLWPFLRMRTKSGQNGSKPSQNSGYVRNRHG